MCLENWGQVQVFTCWVEAVPLQWHSCPEISILRVYSFLISLQCADALIPKKEKEWGCSSPGPPQHESQVQILQIEWKCNAILEMLQGPFVFTIFMLVVALIPLALTVGIFVWERFLMPQSEPILWPCSFLLSASPWESLLPSCHVFSRNTLPCQQGRKAWERMK